MGYSPCRLSQKGVEKASRCGMEKRRARAARPRRCLIINARYPSNINPRAVASLATRSNGGHWVREGYGIARGKLTAELAGCGLVERLRDESRSRPNDGRPRPWLVGRIGQEKGYLSGWSTLGQ